MTGKTLRLCTLIWFTGLLLAAAGPVYAAKRVALVIGNSQYKTAPLVNPVNDARLMTETLKQLGFEVIETLDANQRTMKRAIRDFGKSLDEAGEDAVGLFYYAGHGVQVGGANYLIPIGAEIVTEGDVDIEAVSANGILRTVDFARNNLNIIILDACRNNPYARSFRSGTRGLAEMRAARGVLISYATAPGEVALDGDGENSPYTAALTRFMTEEGLPVEQTFKKVRIAVSRETNGLQTPWESSSLTGEFYFQAKPAKPEKAVTAPRPSPTGDAGQQVAGTARSNYDQAIELEFWNSIKTSKDPAAYEAYLAQYPEGSFASLAEWRISRIRSQQRAEVAAVEPPAPAAPQVAALPPEPQGPAIEDLDLAYIAVKNANVRAEPDVASKRLGRLTLNDEVQVTGRVLDKDWYRIAFQGQQAFVYGPLITEIDPQALSAWQATEAGGTREDYDDYAAVYPTSPFAPLARQESQRLRQQAEEAERKAQEEQRKAEEARRRAEEEQRRAEAAAAAENAQQQAALVAPPKPEAAELGATPAVGVFEPQRQPGERFRDCDTCPEMVVVPAGRFTMGSARGEEGRQADEGPQRQVQVRQAIAVGRYEVTRGQFAAFIAETGHQAKGCYVWTGSQARLDPAKSWRDPGFRQAGDHPAVCVSWQDAKAYVRWLSGKTGSAYRLLSEAEWEYAARAGRAESRPWKGQPQQACRHANVHDQSSRDAFGFLWPDHGCNDGWEATARVGNFPANAFGLHDMLGNVWEWVEDCYAADLSQVPQDGSAKAAAGCRERVLRGGSWVVEPSYLRLANRNSEQVDIRDINTGFRVARALPSQ